MDQLTSIKTFIHPILEAMKIQLYDLAWRQEGNTHILQVAIMHEDGTMDIDTCSDVSEKISALLDEKDIITSEYFLEVCSPGAERALRNDEEIAKAINEFVYVKLTNPKAGLDEVRGTLKEVNEDSIHIDYLLKGVKKHTEIQKDNISLITLAVKV